MTTIKLKKGFNLKLKGAITGKAEPTAIAQGKLYAIIPDDFHGITPRLEKKEGDTVMAGEAIYHDKVFDTIKVTSPVSGKVKEVRRGERRKIEAIIIESDDTQDTVSHDTKQDKLTVLLESGLWVMMSQRPYDVVPNPEIRPRDIFVTAFDSAPLAPDLMAIAAPLIQYASAGAMALSELTDGKVHISFKKGQEIEVEGATCHVVDGPHPAGNVGVQIANIAPVNKGEVIWTLDIVTLCRMGQLFATGKTSYDTLVAVTGEGVDTPTYIKATMGCEISNVITGQVSDLDNKRIISGNVLTGKQVSSDGWLQAPYRHVTVIPELSKKDEFMGWASLCPNRYSIYRMFTTWLAGKRNKECSLDARIKGGERAIVCLDEYDNMLPMDIYAEFLLKAIIAFDIDKMEQLGIYEVAPEDFALAEYADTSKIELQRIVREGLDRMRAEMS